jgi:hypothetical protein
MIQQGASDVNHGAELNNMLLWKRFDNRQHDQTVRQQRVTA